VALYLGAIKVELVRFHPFVRLTTRSMSLRSSECLQKLADALAIFDDLFFVYFLNNKHFCEFTTHVITFCL